MRTIGNSGKKRVSARLAHPVPADLRYFERPSVERRWVAYHASRNDPEAARAILFAVIEQYLDTDTDAKKALARRDHVVPQDLGDAQPIQIFHRGPRRPHTGENNALSVSNP